MFDVTKTGNGIDFAVPALLLVAAGEVNSTGNAWSVAVKTYNGTSIYAFVADATGSLIVFDISVVRNATPPSGTYITNATVLGPATSGGSVVKVAFPKDPYDGKPDNAIDIAIDNNYLYCALARGGFAIIDITNPLAPSVCDIIDTPGIVESLTVRSLAGGDQLIVNDSRCGVRLYQ
jgi:hypothetical protein